MENSCMNLDVNQFPHLTWNHLNINRTHMETAIENAAEASVSGLCDAISQDFKTHTESYNDSEHIETGLGKKFDSEYDGVLDNLSVRTQQFVVKCNADLSEPVKVVYTSNAKPSCADNVIVAKSGSRSTFIFLYADDSDSEKPSVLGNRIRVFAEEYAYVHVITVNLLGKNVLHFDSIGSSVQDNANVEVTELQLGGSRVYSGNYQNLGGYRASYTGRYGYVVKENQFLDINYVCRQKGRETDSKMSVDGIVMDKALKTWRGTIDFVKGAVDSKGDEQENVLLLSPEVVNKSLPVILCDEEAVDGRHGASIGKLGKEILFYMQSRGIDQKSAEQLMVQAKITAICRFIPDSGLVESIIERL